MGKVTQGKITRSRAEWAEKIRLDAQQAVAGIIQMGIDLRQAKEEIPHGEWADFLAQDVKISHRTAMRLMAIAENETLTAMARSNKAHEPSSILPSSWTTLAELARMEPVKLQHAIDEGMVYPEMERKEARNLVAQINDQMEAPKAKARNVPPPSPELSRPITELFSVMVQTNIKLVAGTLRNTDQVEKVLGLIEKVRDWLVQLEDELHVKADQGDNNGS